MYIHFNRKYQKIIWLIIGFLACCFLTDKVLAYSMPNGYEINEETIQNLWDTYFKDKTVREVNPDCNPNYGYPGCDNKYGDSIDPFNFVYAGYYNGSIFIYFARYSEEITISNYNNTTTFDFDSTASFTNTPFSDIDYYYYPLLILNVNNTVTVNYYRGHSAGVTFITGSSTDSYASTGNFTNFALNFNLIQNDTLLKNANFTYPSTGPSYLNGYKKITLTPDDRYYMLSGLSTGSIYIPLDDFLTSGGRLSYYDKDLTSQPYTSYIQDYTITSDGLYARQDFDLSSYYGADFVMFSKYIYLEYEDTTYYDIWVPNNIYDSPVTITPNSSGGNIFDFDYKDTNGNIQNEQFNSIDLTPPQPLLSDVFTNFTTEYYGLSSIVLAPISFLESVNSATCTPLTVPSPVGSTSFSLPCMTPIYETYGGDLFTLYQTITTGFIAYYVGLGYFNLIKGLKDPSDDRIEVIHL